ncbi:MAG: hypothetical protein LRY73_19860 [Bacillus sp. (in: Bacteria)]|nr:hypothetical protein [Bacillus sp. (in: firmicutes)]
MKNQALTKTNENYVSFENSNNVASKFLLTAAFYLIAVGFNWYYYGNCISTARVLP